VLQFLFLPLYIVGLSSVYPAFSLLVICCNLSCRHKEAKARIEAESKAKDAEAAGVPVGLVSKIHGKVTCLLSALLWGTAWILMEGIPGCKLPSLLLLLACMGFMARKAKLNHRRCFWACLFALSEALLTWQFSQVQDSEFFSILMDSSTDISGESHVLIYIKYMARNMVPMTQYLCTINVTAKTSEAAYSALLTALSALGLDPSKLVGFCSDGGSEYTGKEKGVVARLKENLCCYLLATHRAAHRAALAMFDYVRGSEDPDMGLKASDLDGVISDVHGLFNHSAKRQQQWEAFAKPLGLTKLKFPMYNATRWFSRWQCVQVLCENYAALVMYLKSQKGIWPQAAKLNKQLRDVTVAASIAAWADVLGVMNEFSTDLQSDKMLALGLKKKVDDVDGKLKKLVSEVDGVHKANASLMPRFTKFCEGVGGSVNPNWHFKFSSRSANIRLEGILAKHKLLQSVESVSSQLRQTVKDRFPTTDVFDAFKILDPAHWSSTPLSSPLSTEDTKRAATLLAHFNKASNKQKLFADATSEAILSELAHMRQLFLQLADRIVTQDFLHYWREISREHSAIVPRLLIFVQAMLVLPVQTACVERGFSIHRYLKHRLTNHLRLVTLDSIMRFQMLGPQNLDELYDKFSIDGALQVLQAGGGLRAFDKPPFIRMLFDHTTEKKEFPLNFKSDEFVGSPFLEAHEVVDPDCPELAFPQADELLPEDKVVMNELDLALAS
jgi:hypothetical protein